MFKWLTSLRWQAPESVPELTERIRVEGVEKGFFDKALKLYLFSRHVPAASVSKEMADQLTYCGHVVYSLLTNWLRDGKPSLEYLDFLNTRLKELRLLPEEALKGLAILPHEIDEIELQEKVRLRFTDEDTGEAWLLEYEPQTGTCRFGRK